LGVAAVFMGFGAILSLLAPVHTLTLRREGPQSVTADVRQLMLFAVSVRHQTIPNVTGVSSRLYSAPPNLEPSTSPADVVRPELQGFLVLESGGRAIAIPVSPSDVEEVERSVRTFLGGRATVLRLWMVSNWKFGVATVALVVLPGLL